MWSDDTADSATYETLLRTASGAVPDHAVDWDAFHTRLAAHAELPLARLRRPRPVLTVVTTRVHVFPRHVSAPRTPAWWQHTARWSRVVVPGALAASIALIVTIRAMPKDTHAASEPKMIASATIDGEHSRAAFDSAVVGHVSASALATTLLPSAADLLIPLGREGAHR